MEIATLMKGLISIETLGQMPLPFVHILRDMRLKQLEAKKQYQEQQMATQQQRTPNTKQPQQSPMFDESAVQELVDELT